MSDEDRSPLTNNEQREVDRHLKRHPSAVRADLEDAMRRRRQHDARIAKRDRDAAELLAKNAATIARPDLTPEERREAEIAAEGGEVRRERGQHGSPDRAHDQRHRGRRRGRVVRVPASRDRPGRTSARWPCWRCWL